MVFGTGVLGAVIGNTYEFSGSTHPVLLASCTGLNTVTFSANQAGQYFQTSGCQTAQYAASSGTLAMVSNGGYINPTATPITTLTTSANSGEFVTLTAASGGSFPLASGGNINMGGFASPTIVPANATVLLRLKDFPTFSYDLLAISPSPGGAVTATGGTGVTSVTCTSATCTSNRGSYTIVGGTATTGTIVTLVWPAIGTASVCSTTVNGGTAFLGIGHSLATTTGMNITAAVSVAGSTIAVDYVCTP